MKLCNWGNPHTGTATLLTDRITNLPGVVLLCQHHIQLGAAVDQAPRALVSLHLRIPASSTKAHDGTSKALTRASCNSDIMTEYGCGHALTGRCLAAKRAIQQTLASLPLIAANCDQKLGKVFEHQGSARDTPLAYLKVLARWTKQPQARTEMVVCLNITLTLQSRKIRILPYSDRFT